MAELTDAQLWLARADEKLATARKHLADEEYRDAVSDSYYAMFYVARAALASIGLESHRHTGVVSLFSEHFVRTGKVDATLSAVLMRGLQLRGDADYAPRTVISREKAQLALAEAEVFVTNVREHVT